MSLVLEKQTGMDKAILPVWRKSGGNPLTLRE
jgi:hypothetical protein